MQTLDTNAVVGIRGRYQVLAATDEVTWRDGARVGLHRVAAGSGIDCTFLRALRGDDTIFRVIDLRDAVPNLAIEYAQARPGDRPFLLYFSVRVQFESPAALKRWAEAQDPLQRAA
jgi:hypothetical protein